MNLNRLKEYKLLTVDEIRQCSKAIIQIRNRVDSDLPTMYARKQVKQHALNNLVQLGSYIDKKQPANVSGYLLFWIFKQCRFYGVTIPECVPHVIRDTKGGRERFFCVTHEEWRKYVDNTKRNSPDEVISKLIPFTDHAKLRYIDRVLGVDIGELLKDIPHSQLLREAQPELSEQSIEIDGYTYILGKGMVCTTILSPSMSQHPCDKEP